jgi:signal transduction histidine kinase
VQLVSNLLQNFAQQMEAAETEVSFTAPAGGRQLGRVPHRASGDQPADQRLRYGGRSPIQVRVYREGDEARVEVQDRGIGISEENQKRIFQQFERVSAKTVVAGLGLGLFISEQIVAAHGGSIVVERNQRRRLFRVCLPIQENGISDATSE